MTRVKRRERVQPGLLGAMLLLNRFVRGWNETDNNSDEATPVPIPNTAVKLVRVDGIGTQFGAERVDRCRSHPSLLTLNPA